MRKYLLLIFVLIIIVESNCRREVKFKALDTFEWFSLEVLSDGKTVCAEYKKDGKKYIQINENIYGPYDYAVFFRFAKKGRKYMFFYKNNGSGYLWFNDTIYGPYDWVGGPYLSPDGEVFAYQYRKDEKHYFLINQKTYGPFDWVRVQFSTDGEHFGFQCRNNNKYYFQIDDNNYGPFNDIGRLRLSPDGDKYSSSYAQDGKYFVQTENKTYGPFNGFGDSQFSLNNRLFGFWYWIDKEVYAQIDEKVYGPFDYIGPLQFSPNGKIFGFRFVRENNDYIQINDKIYGPFDSWLPFVTSYDSLNISSVRRPNLSFLKQISPLISSDDKKYGFWFLKNSKQYIQINEQIYGPFDHVDGLRLSPDGKKYGFWYKKEGQCYVRINEKIYGPFTRVYYPTYDIEFYYNRDRRIPEGKVAVPIEPQSESKFCYWLNDDDQHYILLNGRIYGPIGDVSSPGWRKIYWEMQFSSDGREFGFFTVKYEEKGKCARYVQINDKTYGPFNDIYVDFKFTTRGPVIAYYNEGYIYLKDVR